MTDRFDVAVIGAGAAGMMCAAVAGQRGRSVVLLDHAQKLAEKIRISGGGRCNFTNRDVGIGNFLSENPDFARATLARYTPRDFVDLVKRHRIGYHEKHRGQLFCDDASERIIAMLVAECDAGNVEWRRPAKPGTLFTNKTLSQTYARILKEAESAGSDRVAQIEAARKAWSHGFVAEAIDKFCRTQEVMDVSGSPHRGVLSADDMARWQPGVEAPLTYDYGRYTVCKPGVWSQGPVMLQQLALLKGFELDGLDPAGPEFIHLQTECAKLAFADREKFYGDPNFSEIPIQTLLSDTYNDERRKLISETASLDFIPGSVEGFGAVVKLRRQEGSREAVGAMGAGEPTVGRFGEVRGDTVHFDIIDQAGNMISATPSGGWLQSSPVIPELGFCLGSRAQMFWLEEDHPAALAPGKRPRTTLSPTMALRDGEPYLAWGSPGGDQQDQWTTQFFLRHVHAKMNLQEAIDAPAWHSEHFPISFWPRTARPGVLVVENRVPKATVDALKGRGHMVETGPDWSEGRLTAASKIGRRRRAAANPRGMQGYAAGR